ncbi:MAG: DUF2341 domain-containing protein [Salibacteraceae bacterium]
MNIYNIKSKVSLLLLSVVLVMLNISVTAQPCLNGWQYSKQVIIENQNGNALSNFQFSIDINTLQLINAGKMNLNGSDIRILDKSGAQMPLWVESNSFNTTQSKIWFKHSIAANTTDTVYLFYGANNASNSSDGSQVFELFDGFSGSLSLTAWDTCGAGGYSVSNGVLSLTGSVAEKAVLVSKTLFANNSVFEMGVNEVSKGNAFLGAANVGVTSEGYVMNMEEVAPSIDNIRVMSISTAGHCFNLNPLLTPDNSGFVATQTDGTWSFNWFAAAQQSFTWPSGSDTAIASSITLPGSYSMVLGIGEKASGSLKLDWVRARKYANTPPQVSVGSEIEYINSVTASVAESSVCESDSIKLSANYVNGATYSWTGPNSFSSSDQNPVITGLSTLNSGLYKVNISLGGNCSNASDSVIVNVSSLSVSGTLSGTDTVCANSNSGTLELNGQNGKVIYWETSPTGNTPWSTIASTNDSLNYTNLNATQYYRAVVENGSCANATGNNIKISVDNNSVGGYVVGNQPVCKSTNQGQLQLLNSTGTIVDWSKSIDLGSTWSSESSTSNKLQFINVSDTTWYRAEVKSGVCNSAYSDTFKLNVYPLPNVAFTANSSCQNQGMSFTNSTSITNGNIINYNWNFGNGTGSTLENPVVSYSNSGKIQVTLTATSDQGCQGFDADSVSVFPNPTAQFMASTHCEGDSTSFTNSSSIGSGNITSFNWVFGDQSGSSIIQNPKYLYGNNGAYSVKLVVTSDSNCVDSVINQVLVNENPMASFSFDTVTVGNQTVFQNKSSISVGALSASWKFGDGTSSSFYSPTHSYSSSGKYGTQLIVTSINNCKDTLSDSVLVVVRPVADFTIASECFMDTSLFMNTSTNNTGALTYHWSFGDGQFSSDSLPKHVYAQPGLYTVKLTVTNSFGHTDEIQKSAIVYNLPSAKYTASSVCDTDTVAFVNQSTLASGVLNYLWHFGDGNTSSSRNVNYRYGSSGNYTTKLIVYSAQGCYDSISAPIDVFPRPIVSFAVDTVCFGDTTSFTNQSSIFSGTITHFAWSFGNGLSSNLQSPKIAYSQVGTYSATLTATSDKGCIMSEEESVGVSAEPQAGFQINNVCDGDTVIIQNQTSGVVGNANYYWSFGDGRLSNSSATTLAHTYSTSGQYTVSLKVEIGKCVDSIFSAVSVYAKPVVQFVADTACLGQPTTFTNNTSISRGKIDSYLWNLGNGYNSIETNPVISYTLPGIYQVSVKATSDTGCVSSSLIPVLVYDVPRAIFEVGNVCDRDSIEVINKSIVPIGSNSFTWNFGDGNSSNTKATQFKYLYTNAGDFNLSLKIETVDGCADSTSSKVSVFPMPTTAFNVDTVCFGLTTEFVNGTQIIGGTIDKYLWDFGNGITSIEHNPKLKYTYPGNYIVSLKAITDKWCEVEVINSAVVNVQPIAFFNAESVCANETVIFENKTEVTSGPISYIWDFGNDNISTLTEPAESYERPGRYEVKLIAKTPFNCVDSIIKPVWSYALPEPYIMAESDSLSKGYSTQLFGYGGSVYTWSPQESLSRPNSRITQATPEETMFYYLDVLDSNGCAGSTSIEVEVVDDFKLIASNVLTPDNNGKNDLWVIKYSEAYENIEVTIADRWGRIVYTNDDYNNEWDGNNDSGEQLPDGNYFYIVTRSGSSNIYKGTITILRNN